MNQPFVERRKVAIAPALMTEDEVAKRLNVSVASLRRWRLLGKGPVFIKVGSLVRYRAEDLDSWLAATLPQGGSTSRARVGQPHPGMGQAGRAASEGQRKEDKQEERRQVMAVYKPKRKGESSKFYVCEFVYQGKRFQESTGATSKTVAKEYEKRRKAEMERAAAGLPTEQKAARIRTVDDVLSLTWQATSSTIARRAFSSPKGRLAHVKKALGNVVLSDLTDDRIRDYIRQRQARKGLGPHDQHGAWRIEPRDRAAVVAACGRRSGSWKSGRTWAARFPGGAEGAARWTEGPPHAAPRYR